MSEANVLVSIDEGVATITLNRPRARNALSAEMVRALQEELEGLRAPGDIRCCVLTGAGTAFCAGADLRQRMTMTPEEVETHTGSIRHCADMLEELPFPVVAAVNGPAFAGGMELAIACDIRIASSRASFSLSEVKLGIFPGAGGPIRLSKLIGPGWARLMVFEGEAIQAEEALRIGLVQRLAAEGDLMGEALRIARNIAAHDPAGVRAAKDLMNRSDALSYEEAVRLSDSLRAPLNRAARWQEGLRKPGEQG